MDGYKAITFKRKNMIGLNVDNKMIYTHVKHEALIAIVKSLDNIKNINLNLSNGYVYMVINYKEESQNYYSYSDKSNKFAGLDIGVRNTLALYINDSVSNSIIIDGKKYISYNSKFNRLISKINEEIDFTTDQNRIIYLNNFKMFLYEKRKNYYIYEFHKLSKYLLKYLKHNDVTHLVLSKNISSLKNNGTCKINKNIKQHFMQIPLVKLVDYICLKSLKYNIQTILIDESYTSKTSSISKDIFKIKAISLNKKLSTDDFGGSRVKRGLFKDYKYNKVLNSDLNGAFNICKLGITNDNFVNTSYKKLCNPIKIKCEDDLINLFKLVV